MSQFRNIGGGMREAIVVFVVWALMFGVSISGAASASAEDAAFRNGAPAGVGLFACFKRHVTQRADAATEKAPEGHSSNYHHHCPCCLAATATAAVLPERAAALALRAPSPITISFVVEATREPGVAQSRSAHGARAPPSLI